MKYLLLLVIAICNLNNAFSQCNPVLFKNDKQAADKALYQFYQTSTFNVPVTVLFQTGSSTKKVIYNIWDDSGWVSLPETVFSVNMKIYDEVPRIAKWNDRLFAFSNSCRGYNNVKAPSKKIIAFLEFRNGNWDTLPGGNFDSTYASTFVTAAANNSGLYFQLRSPQGEGVLYKYDTSAGKFNEVLRMNDNNGSMSILAGPNRLIVSSMYKAAGDSVYGVAYIENDSFKVLRDSFFNLGAVVGIDAVNDHFYAFQRADNPAVREYSNTLVNSRPTNFQFDKALGTLIFTRVVNGKIAWAMFDNINQKMYVNVLCPGDTKWKTTILNYSDWGFNLANSRDDIFMSHTKLRKSFLLKNGSLVRGTALVDLDSNCAFNDTVDFALKHHLVNARATSNDYTISALTDSKGAFELYVAKDTFILSGPGKSSPCFTDTAIVTSDTLDKDLLIKRPGFKDLKVNMSGGFSIRWNGNAAYMAVLENMGEPSDSAHFEFRQDAKIRIAYVDSNVTFYNDSIARGVLRNLTYFDKRYIRISSWVDSSATKPDSVVCHYFSAYLFENEKDSTNNTNDFCQTVVYSMDPNFKECNKKEIAVNESQFLDYFIEFQNEGNGDAEDVVIEDLLSPNLDIRTLKITGTSHPYTYSVEGRKLRITFNSIFLKPKKTNEMLSKGFVKLSVMCVPGLKDKDSITNYASIYFDLNLPVKTNTSVVRVSKNATAVEKAVKLTASLVAYPNPSGAKVTILTPLNEEISIFTMNGKLIYHVLPKDGKAEINAETWSDGIYLIRCGNLSFKFIKETL